MISIYIAVSNQDKNIDWANEYIEEDWVYDETIDDVKNVLVEYDGNIKNFSAIREGYDYKKGAFTYDDIEIEAYNINEFWSDKIFHNSTRKIEIRIVGFKQRGEYTGRGWYVAERYDYEPIFAGVILLDDYEIIFKEGLKQQHKKYCSYKFRTFNMLKVLEQKSVHDLRTELEKTFPPVYANLKYTNPIKTSAYNRYNNYDYEYSFKENYEVNDNIEWEFIRISDVVKSIFSLIGIPLPYFSIQSEFYFMQRNIYNAPVILVESLYVPFRKWSNGKEPKNGFYSRKFFDNNIFDSEDENINTYKPPTNPDDTTAHQWSFYNFNNCVELLCNLSHSLGVVWYMKYNIAQQYNNYNDKPYLFEAQIKCTKRRYSINDSPTAVIIKNLKEANVKVSNAEPINGYKIISPDLDDYMIGTKDDITLNLLFALWNPNLVNHNDRYYNANKKGLIWEHCLYYFDGNDFSNGRMRFLDTVGYEVENNDFRYEATINRDLNHCLMEAIAKYYADKNFGIWSDVFLSYELTFLSAKGFETNKNFELNQLTDTYQAIKPSHIIKIENDNNDILIITRVEKDIFRNNTKLVGSRY
jgi:hypothetical protein